MPVSTVLAVVPIGSPERRSGMLKTTDQDHRSGVWELVHLVARKIG